MREPTYFMLVALATGEPLHGYAIAKRAEALSEGRVRITAGTLYGAIERLVDNDSIRLHHEEVVKGRNRRYYKITDQGRDEVTAEVARMQAAIEAAQESAAFSATPGLAGTS